MVRRMHSGREARRWKSAVRPTHEGTSAKQNRLSHSRDSLFANTDSLKTITPRFRGAMIFSRLQASYVCCLRSTLTFDDVELDTLPFFQSTESIADNRCVVDEHVVRTFDLDEPIAFFRIKPFYCSLH
jgi:hypothetical protein